jgi:hypothetical protein
MPCTPSKLTARIQPLKANTKKHVLRGTDKKKGRLVSPFCVAHLANPALTLAYWRLPARLSTLTQSHVLTNRHKISARKALEFLNSSDTA